METPRRFAVRPHRLGSRNRRRKIGSQREEPARSRALAALASAADARELKWNVARFCFLKQRMYWRWTQAWFDRFVSHVGWTKARAKNSTHSGRRIPASSRPPNMNILSRTESGSNLGLQLRVYTPKFSSTESNGFPAKDPESKECRSAFRFKARG